MTLYQIWDLASYIAGKFANSGAVPPSRFNTLLPECQDEWYQSLLNEVVAASANEQLLNRVLSSTPLQPFKATETLSPVDGVSELPSNYRRYISAHTDQYVSSEGASSLMPWRMIAIVSDELYASKRGDVLTRADIEPFAKIVGLNMHTVPFKHVPTIDYFRTPLTPVFDYCQATDNPNRIIYMPAGSYIDEVNGINILYDEDGNLLYTDVTKDTMNSLPFYSSTVELEWSDQHHHHFVFMVLAKVGVNIGEGEVEKYALLMQQGK